MSLPVDKWCRAIAERISRRKYIEREVKPALLQIVKESCGRFTPFDGVRSVLVEDNSGEVFSGIIGSYGRVVGAPAYIALIGDTTVEDVEAKVGYTGEGIVLEATSLGLDTCWIAGFFRPEIVAQHIVLAQAERVFAVSPLGYAKDRINLAEKMTRRFAGSDRRKPSAQLCSDWESAAWPEWARAGVELARVAPSAVNRQPWRFRIQDGAVVISVDGKDTYHISKRLDCGIAMLHIELGAAASGLGGAWTFLDAPDVARFDPAPLPLTT